MDRETNVGFVSEKLEKCYQDLKTKKFEDIQLHKFINRAIDDLKENPKCGTKIQKTLWPKEYAKRFQITNLWKYDLPNAWRLIYTIEHNEITIISIILEWFNHKKYEKKFRY